MYLTKVERQPYSRPDYKRTQPRELGIGMTICIASITKDGELVTVSDHMLSFHDGIFTAESAALKQSSLTADWFALYASDDVGGVPSLLARIESKVGGWNDVLSVTDMTAHVGAAFQEERLFRAEELHLRPNRLDLETLYQPDIALSRGESTIALLRDRVEQHSIGTELLVCGYDANPGHISRSAHILHVTHPGIVKNYEMPGYWAIGKGSLLALSWLASRRHSRFHSMAMGIYHLCEAKFSAEGASDVGKETFVVVHSKDRKWKSAEKDRDPLGVIRVAWEEHGRPAVPNDVAVKVHQWPKSEDGWLPKPSVVMPSASQTLNSSSSQAGEASAETDRSHSDG